MEANLRRKIDNMSVEELREALFDVSYAALSNFDPGDTYEALMKHDLPACECDGCLTKEDEDAIRDIENNSVARIDKMVDEVWGFTPRLC